VGVLPRRTIRTIRLVRPIVRFDPSAALHFHGPHLSIEGLNCWIPFPEKDIY